MMKKRFTFLGGVIAVMLLSLPTWAYVQTQQRAGETVEPVEAPYTADFSVDGTFEKFITLDANKDGATWISNRGSAACTSNDDYLILPISLKANKTYDVTVNAGVLSNFFFGSDDATFEVVAGQTATVEGMATSVISVTKVTTDDFTDTGSFTTTEAGTWYIAIHVKEYNDNTNYNYGFMVQSLSVIAQQVDTAPAAVTDLKATAGEEGALTATLEFTAPSNSIKGDALDTGSKLTVKFYRDKVLVGTKDEVAPGSTVTWTDDKNLEDGKSYSYYVIATDENGDDSKESNTATVYVGQDSPADVENVKITANTDEGITLTWEAVKGANGGYVNSETVEYDVLNLGSKGNSSSGVLATVIGKTEATVKYEGKQDKIYFGVIARIGDNVSGIQSDGCKDYTLVGDPYELPIEETFTGGASYFWDYDINNVYFDVSNGILSFSITSGEGEEAIESGKFSLKSTKNPTLIFDAWKNSSHNINQMSVYAIASDGTNHDMETITLQDESKNFIIDIPEELKDKDWARIGFKVNFDGQKFKYIYLDNIKIFDFLSNDLSIAVSAPKTVEAGNKATVTATVKNEGKNAIKDYTVVIKAGDKEILNQKVEEELQSFATTDITADFQTTIFDDAADVTITATVVYDADENEENNTAETMIAVTELTAPGVASVAAEGTDEGVVVSWTAPEVKIIETKEVTESFEDGDGGWTFIDADGDDKNWSVGENNNGYHVNSGTHYVASNPGWGATNVQNWLVSPEVVLDGTFQFYAEGSSEKFQVYVSTTSATDVETFEAVSDQFIGGGSPTKYSVDLTSYAGAKGWVAICHNNPSVSTTLYIDDITYLVSGGAVAIKEYNIYVDGELKATAQSEETSVVIKDTDLGDHKFAVSVVYENGLVSKPVVANEVTVQITDAGYATFCAGQNVDFSGTDVTVYTAKINDENTHVVLTEVPSKQVPAGNAVVLKAAAEGKYIGKVVDSAEALTDNELVAAEEEVTGDGTIFVLNKVGDDVGFYKLKVGETLAAGKGYLKYTGTNARGFYGFGEDGATAIKNMKVGMEDNVYYDLQGHRVLYPTKGLYIMNGKKVIVK